MKNLNFSNFSKKKNLKFLIKKKSLQHKLDKFTELHKGCNATKDFKKLTRNIIKKTLAKKIKKKKGILALIDKAKDNSKLVNSLIDKIKVISDLPTTRELKNILAFKQTYKMLTEFYQFKLERIKRYKIEVDISIKETIYEFFSKGFGISNLAEKRLMEFLTSAVKFKENKKIQIFLRFIGVFEESNYRLSEQKLYLDALNYVSGGENTRGFEVPIDHDKGVHYVAFIRCEDFLKEREEGRLNLRARNFAYNELERLKKPDKAYGNLEGVVDFDSFVFLMVMARKLSIETNISKALFIILFGVFL